MAEHLAGNSVKRFRLPARFSLRALFIAVAVMSVALIVANHYLRPKLEHRIAVGRIFGAGGAVWFEDKSSDIGVRNPYTEHPQSLWLSVDSVDVKNDAQAIVVAQELASIPEMGAIEFGRGVTDVGLTAVCECRNRESIQVISFFLCSVTSNGLSRLDQLPNLRQIMFNTFPINAAGLAELRKLPGLKSLRFVEEPPGRNSNRLNDACFREIGQLTQLKSLSFAAVAVSDMAAGKLHSLKQLEELSFHQGFISDAAVSELRSALPATQIKVY